MGSAPPSYRGHRYPVEVISHCVWLCFRFRLSFREVEELFQRGILVSHETVRRWCAKFGQAYANGLRRRHARPGDKWHLDEVFVKINGEQKYLWRAVDQDGMVLDILVQNRRERLPQRRRSPAIPVRVQRHLTPLPTPPPPDERPRLPSRDGHPLRAIWDQITGAAGQPAKA